MSGSEAFSRIQDEGSNGHQTEVERGPFDRGGSAAPNGAWLASCWNAGFPPPWGTPDSRHSLARCRQTPAESDIDADEVRNCCLYALTWWILRGRQAHQKDKYELGSMEERCWGGTG
jgi:hypothetical protein